MAKGPTYRVKFRRRREGKTNYYRRRRLLLSRQPRFVVRKTNNRTVAQIIGAKMIGDETLASAISSELSNFGWEAGIGNMPAAYLTGFLAGLRAKARGINNAILDVGLHPPIKGSKIYAALKGAVDAGLEIPHDPEVLPPEERISGEHIVEAYKHFQEDTDSGLMFSEIGKKKTVLTRLPKAFEAVKSSLLEIPKDELRKPKKKTPAKAKSPAKKPKEKKEKPSTKAPRAKPKKQKPKKLIARGKKGRKRK